MRSKTTWLSGFLLIASVAWPGGAPAVEVKLRATETEKVGRKPAVITTGVPFARGTVKDIGKLKVTVGDNAVPAQFLKTVRWDDGSVRWALMDVQASVPAGGVAVLVVSDSGGNPPPPAAVEAKDAAGAVRVSTGPLEFVVNKKKFNLFESLKVDGKELIAAAGGGLVLVKADGGEVCAGVPSQVKVEQAGPMRAIVCVKGKFPGVHKGLLSYTVRISAFAGRKHVKIHVWIENAGSAGYYYRGRRGKSSPSAEWFLFRGMKVDLALGMGGTVSAKCEGAEGSGRLKVLQVCKRGRGAYAKAPIHRWEDFEYSVTSGGTTLKKGKRTDGVVEIKGGAGQLTAAVRDFWQNYEKAIEVDGKALRLWLWPVGGQWPRERLNTSWLHEDILVPLSKKGHYLLPGAVHKGHEFILDFSGRGAKEAGAELSAPLMALASADYYASTGALPGLFAPLGASTGDEECDAQLAARERMDRSAADPASPSGLPRARRTGWAAHVGGSFDNGYHFGWMDFGDLCTPGQGTVALHYDWTWIMLLGAVRTGDRKFLRLGGDMARHRIDIDQLWSDRDMPQVSGLQRGDTGPPTYHCVLWRPPTPGTNWLAGVALYYMLTGEPKALECCARNTQGLKRCWSWVAKTKPWAGPQNDIAASTWTIAAYCSMYSLTAEKKWLDESLSMFKTYLVPRWRKLGPFMHDPRSQFRSQEYVKEDMKYCYSVVPLCDLQRLTGNAEVLKLLKEGCAKPFPEESFFGAPLFLSDLYAYVGWRTKDRKLLSKAAAAFSESFPTSKCPPVFLPKNSNWSRTSATTLRCGHLLQYAGWKMNSVPRKRK